MRMNCISKVKELLKNNGLCNIKRQYSVYDGDILRHHEELGLYNWGFQKSRFSPEIYFCLKTDLGIGIHDRFNFSYQIGSWNELYSNQSIYDELLIDLEKEVKEYVKSFED